MHTTIPLILAALLALAIMVIGGFYLLAPQRISGSFGLKPPASDLNTRAWLRLKGHRDIASGLLVFAMMLAGNNHMVGMVLLVEAIVPLGDMSVILASGGSKSTAFSVHGLTCAVMIL